MRFYSVMFASATVPSSLPSLAIGREPAASFAAGVTLAPSGRYVARSIEILIFAMLLALIAPARAETYPVLLKFPVISGTDQVGKVLTSTTGTWTGATSFAYQWSGNHVPIKGATAATYTPVSSDAGHTLTSTVVATGSPGALSSATSAATVPITGGGQTTAAAAAYPVLLEFPVITGTAQVGKVLTSTTGTWTGATSFAYQWSGNKTPIAGATAATYTPVSSDAGHTLTSTVVATGSPGARSSATSAATVPIVAASSGSPPVTVSGSVPFTALHTYYMSPTGSDSNNGTSPPTPWATPYHSVVLRRCHHRRSRLVLGPPKLGKG